jgi:hypothetical protein
MFGSTDRNPDGYYVVGCSDYKPVSLHARLVRAGVEVSNGQSDLYFPVTPETTAILDAAAAADAVREALHMQK